jgi:hypothetical protein
MESNMLVNEMIEDHFDVDMSAVDLIEILQRNILLYGNSVFIEKRNGFYGDAEFYALNFKREENEDDKILRLAKSLQRESMLVANDKKELARLLELYGNP